MNKDIENYIKNVREDQRPALEELRERILHHFPDAEEGFDNRFPVYKRAEDGHWLAGFAHGTKGVMFYLMDQAILDKHADALDGLRTGRSCVKFKETKTLTLDKVRKLVDRMLKESAKKNATA